MKAIVLFLALAAGCSSPSDDTLEFNQANLIGSWTLVETLSDLGDGNGTFKKVENGYSISLNADGTFTSERLKECKSGTYTIDNSGMLVFNYDCEGFTEIYEDMASFSGSNLITSPILPSRCIEICKDKFRKNL